MEAAWELLRSRFFCHRYAQPSVDRCQQVQHEIKMHIKTEEGKIKRK